MNYICAYEFNGTFFIFRNRLLSVIFSTAPYFLSSFPLSLVCFFSAVKKSLSRNWQKSFLYCLPPALLPLPFNSSGDTRQKRDRGHVTSVVIAAPPPGSCCCCCCWLDVGMGTMRLLLGVSVWRQTGVGRAGVHTHVASLRFLFPK